MTSILRSSALLILAAVALGGCVSVKLDHTGQMEAQYQFGEFKMLLNATGPASAQAARKALAAFELYETKYTESSHDARIEARARNDQKVLIIIKEDNRFQTLLRIRWGEGGDLEKSRKFYEAVEANLK